ncbi:hypothetical protein [Pseudomonas salmasensis]|uniref:hypothetical protein n=1 Tax=Pseudomonas salmasensis TaxID=2745514 RepID=UPI001644A8BA|nr:hypothetical protein [Pseudomonas salmasensis]QXH81075.1 hypothetical protein HU731_010140 [Pseudomonas salmasensis]
MLAKNFNDNACLLNERGAFEFFASKLAPTKKPLGLPAKANGNHDAKRVALDLDLAFDLRRPVKPRWPEFDRDLGGKPAGMPV